MAQRIATRKTPDGGEACLVRYEPGEVHPPHGHARASVSLVLAGALREEVRGRGVDARCLERVVKPAGTVHGNRFGPRGALVVQLVPGADVEHDARDDLAPLRRWSWSGLGPRAPWLALVRALADDGEGADAHAGPGVAADDAGTAARRATSVDLDDAAAEVLAALDDDAPTRGPPPAWLRAARERLEEDAHAPPSLAALAAEHGVHRVHLARAFRRHYGASPTEVRLAARLRRAAGLLADASASRPASAVALDAGYADQAHMSRAFRAGVGATPREFRRLVRGLLRDTGRGDRA